MEDPRGEEGGTVVDLVHPGEAHETQDRRPGDPLPGPPDAPDLVGSPVDVTVDLVPRPGMEDELRRVVERNARVFLARTPDCLLQVVQEGPDGVQTFIQRWVDEPALVRFGASGDNADYLESLVGLLAAPVVPRLSRPRVALPDALPHAATA